jgi:L-ascorbate metabolism protein UlaG (beta-lactamase superfamily)
MMGREVGGSTVQVTRFGGPTVLVEIDGWRFLTDPTFDDAGNRYTFGFGSASWKTLDSSARVDALPPIDAVLLSHDHHGDNLDLAGRAFLPRAATVLTTSSGADRLGLPNTFGLLPGESFTLEHPDRPSLEITATPCRHGPPLSKPVVGDVIGFAIRRVGARRTSVWITGDTVLYGALRRVARSMDVAVAIVHLGAVRFSVTGPLRYSMNAREAIALIDILQPDVAVPVHYDGWSHFTEPEKAIRRRLDASPQAIRDRFRWLRLGQPRQLPDTTHASAPSTNNTKEKS